jgi:hypothetical protein
MGTVKAYEDMIVLRPREDLDSKWNSSTLITPDSAMTGAASLTIGARRDDTAIAEVLSIGPGSAECPDLAGISIGDIVAIPLYGASKVLVLDKEVGIMVRFRGLAGIVRNLGRPSESIEAINDYVLTKQDRDAFEKHMFGGLLLPEDYLSDGMPVDAGAAGIVRVCLERVVSTGGGVWETTKGGQVKVNPRLWKPLQRKGELVGFNPLSSCRFRRFGVWYHLVPKEDVQFGFDPEA